MKGRLVVASEGEEWSTGGEFGALCITGCWIGDVVENDVGRGEEE